jgi:hypothetical protein
MAEPRGPNTILPRIGRRVYGALRQSFLLQRARNVADALRCPGVHGVDPRNSDSGWVGWQTTPGERAVIEFLTRTACPESPEILHVGIGNGDLGRSLSGRGARVVGITIAGGEIAHGGVAYRRTHLVNKYALPELAAVLGDAKFGWIADVNLFSYTCCWGHAMRYLWFLGDHLVEDGAIVSHWSGARYAPTGHVLTPMLLARVSSLAKLRVEAGPGEVFLLKRHG